MEGLINVEKNIKNSTEKGLVNFKKIPKERLTFEYVEIRLEKLEQQWSSFMDNNSKLYENYEKLQSSNYVSENIYYEPEETFITYKSLMKTVINNKPKVSGTTEFTSKASAQSVKLPKIPIPIFSGRYSEWTTFRDFFQSLIHNNKTLDNVQKLHYLKGHLSGEAEQLIRHTLVTDANYDECWLQLEKRYNNPRYLSNCIFKRFFEQKKMISESASALKELLDTTTDCLKAYNNLNINVIIGDSMVLYYIVNYKLNSKSCKLRPRDY